jgi:hypothetical protein
MSGSSVARSPLRPMVPARGGWRRARPASAARGLGIDDVGCLPQRAGYPVPQPHLLKLLHQLGEQFAQWRQVKHPWFAAGVHHPSGLRGVGRAARLVSNVADNGAAPGVKSTNSSVLLFSSQCGASPTSAWRSAKTSTLALADPVTCHPPSEVDHPDQDVQQSGQAGAGTKARELSPAPGEWRSHSA